MLNIEAGVVAAILTAVVVTIVFGIRHVVNEYKQLQKMNCDELQKQKLYERHSQPDILCVDAKHADEYVHNAAYASTLIFVCDDNTTIKPITPTTTNCPNCGAPILRGHDCCPYCDTLYRMQSAS